MVERDVRELLHANGLRDTPQRRQVLDLLISEGATHLSPGQVYEHLLARGSSVDRATVYRALTTLSELDVIHEVVEANGAISYGRAPASHHHAVCTSCGGVTDLAETDSDVMEALRRVRHVAGFDESAALTVRGVCPSCQAH